MKCKANPSGIATKNKNGFEISMFAIALFKLMCKSINKKAYKKILFQLLHVYVLIAYLQRIYVFIRYCLEKVLIK